jgi:hypothetical protein
MRSLGDSPGSVLVPLCQAMPAIAARTITLVVLEHRFSAEGNGTSVAIDGSRQAGDTLTVNAVGQDYLDATGGLQIGASNGGSTTSPITCICSSPAACRSAMARRHYRMSRIAGNQPAGPQWY